MVIKRSLATSLVLGSLGVVFGDIGTSPLYAFQAIFGPLGRQLPLTQENVIGITSLIIWSLTIVVSIKYLGFVMRADNNGEGGILALVARIKGSSQILPAKWFFILIGVIGAALFYGDSAITPAISVLSAIEGIKTVSPHVSSLVIPATLMILLLLFFVQKYGTAMIGNLFGPVMVLWFITIGLAGLRQVIHFQGILIALSPTTAGSFVVHHPITTFIAFGAVILAITGAEALYADMGHFGRPAISRSWFGLVFPALLLCYMGQACQLIINPLALRNPFLSLFPPIFEIPVIILATLATLIASQAVISGAFSLTHQAIQLDLLPRMLVRHTSTKENGQIYLPLVNSVLFVAVITLVLVFRSSERLAGAYGVAVSGTLTVTSLLYMYLCHTLWRVATIKIVLFGFIFLTFDLLFVSSGIPKLFSGGWLPASIAIIIYVLIRTWMKGQHIIIHERNQFEGKLQPYIDKIHQVMPQITRISGTAVYIGHHEDYAPLALHESIEENRELHNNVVIVSVQVTNAAHIPEDQRATFNNLKYNDGISHLRLAYGYHDTANVPRTLATLRSFSPELDFNLSAVVYFVSMSKVIRTNRPNMYTWQKQLYCFMDRNALSLSDYIKLPINRTTEIRSLLKL